jgi:hypothetical protein
MLISALQLRIVCGKTSKSLASPLNSGLRLLVIPHIVVSGMNKISGGMHDRPDQALIHGASCSAGPAAIGAAATISLVTAGLQQLARLAAPTASDSDAPAKVRQALRTAILTIEPGYGRTGVTDTC